MQSRSQQPQQSGTSQQTTTSNQSSTIESIKEDESNEFKKRERKNRPGQKFGAKKKSWVWSWFIQDSTNPNIAACDYCGKIIIRLPSDKGSPKKLSEHLKTHKLSKESINYSRPIPIDGFGTTYTNNGEPLNYPNQFDESSNVITSTSPRSPIIGTSSHSGTNDASNLSNGTQNQTHNSSDQNALSPNFVVPGQQFDNGYRKEQLKRKEAYSLINHRRFVSSDFDNTPYSPMKFHKHLMKFLTENKLPIHVIKSQSFQQLIYDLRSDSINDLMELTSLYSGLLEVSRYEPGGTEDETVNAVSSVVEKAELSLVARANSLNEHA
jgi:hypothetical protein